MSEMIKEERVVCALSLEEADRVPLYDLISNLRVLEYYAEQPINLENADKVVPLAVSRALDMTRVWLPQPLGKRVDERGFVYERKEPFNEWLVDRPFHTIEETISFIKDDIERLESWEPPNKEEQERQLQDRLRMKEKYQGTVLPASTTSEALSTAYTLLGLDLFIYLENEEPQLVKRWLEVLHQQTMTRLSSEKSCYKVSPVAWIFDDIAYKGRLMFSPAYLREHNVFQHIADICDIYHSYGLKVIFHSDGYIRPIIPDLIAAGIDALAPVEIGAGMSLKELKTTFGNQVAFVGGIDLRKLRFGTVEEVRQTILDTLAIMAPGGGFILGSDSEELLDVLPLENVIAMHETTKECGRYPIGKFFPKNESQNKAGRR